MSINKIGIFIFSALFISQAGNSQVKREILVEDPKQTPNLRFDITPLNLNASSDDNYNSAEYALRATYRWDHKLSLSAEYRGEIADMTRPGTYVSKDYTGNAFELFGTFYFSAKEKEKEVLLPIKARSTGYRTVEITIDPIPVNRLVMYGARVGYGGISNTSDIYSAKLRNANGLGETISDAIAQPIQKTAMVYAGLSNMRIQNIKVKYPVYGTRRKQFIREYYLDGIYAISNSFSNVRKTENGKTDEYIVDPSTVVSKIGARVGFFNTSAGRLINLGWGAEMGFLPRSNTFSKGLYWNLRFSIPLAFKVGQPTE